MNLPDKIISKDFQMIWTWAKSVKRMSKTMKTRLQIVSGRNLDL